MLVNYSSSSCDEEEASPKRNENKLSINKNYIINS